MKARRQPSGKTGTRAHPPSPASARGPLPEGLSYCEVLVETLYDATYSEQPSLFTMVDSKGRIWISEELIRESLKIGRQEAREKADAVRRLRAAELKTLQQTLVEDN